MTLGIILAFGALAMGVAGLIVMRVARASSPTFPLVTRPMDNTGRDEVPAPIRPDLSAGQLVATLVATVYPEQVTTAGSLPTTTKTTSRLRRPCMLDSRVDG